MEPVYETNSLKVYNWDTQGFAIYYKGGKKMGIRKTLNGAIAFADKQQSKFIPLGEAINKAFYAAV